MLGRKFMSSTNFPYGFTGLHNNGERLRRSSGVSLSERSGIENGAVRLWLAPPCFSLSTRSPSTIPGRQTLMRAAQRIVVASRSVAGFGLAAARRRVGR